MKEVRSSEIEGEEDAARQRNEARVFSSYAQATIDGYEREGGWSHAAEIRVREAVNQALATHFGIGRRVGHRKTNP